MSPVSATTPAITRRPLRNPGSCGIVILLTAMLRPLLLFVPPLLSYMLSHLPILRLHPFADGMSSSRPAEHPEHCRRHERIEQGRGQKATENDRRDRIED